VSLGAVDDDKGTAEVLATAMEPTHAFPFDALQAPVLPSTAMRPGFLSFGVAAMMHGFLSFGVAAATTALQRRRPFAAPQTPATPQTAASPAPFYCTGGKPGEAQVREKVPEPMTAFSFNAPVAGYARPQTMGLNTGEVKRSESVKAGCI
jgi:hypothetical protein